MKRWCMRRRSGLMLMVFLCCALCAPGAAASPGTEGGDRRLEKGYVDEGGVFRRLVGGKWHVSIDQSDLGDRHDAAIVLESVEWRGTPGRMYIRCQSGELDVFFSFTEYMGQHPQRVEYRIDNEPIVATLWGYSRNGRFVFANPAADFLRALRGTQRLALRTYPQMRRTIETLFDVTGIEQVLEPVENACNVNLRDTAPPGPAAPPVPPPAPGLKNTPPSERGMTDSGKLPDAFAGRYSGNVVVRGNIFTLRGMIQGDVLVRGGAFVCTGMVTGSVFVYDGGRFVLDNGAIGGDIEVDETSSADIRGKVGGSVRGHGDITMPDMVPRGL